MYKINFLSCILWLVIVCTSVPAFSQDENEKPEKPEQIRRSKFRVGLYVATIFPASNTVSFYDGYGYDIYGNKNDFSNSFMNRTINYFYGGGSNQPDQVAVALGVNHGDWTFDQTDMPSDLKYNIAFAFGAHASWNINSSNALVFNFTSTKLSVEGNFTITLTAQPQTPQQPGYINVKTFGITGSEQRFIFQLGYQHVFGEEGGFNFFAEGGAACTLSKFLNNRIAINNLQMDLGSYYYQPLWELYREEHLSGIGFGAWTGCGFTTGFDARTTLQFVYNPTLEKISIGENTDLSLNHYIGLKIYYNLWRRAVMKERL